MANIVGYAVTANGKAFTPAYADTTSAYTFLKTLRDTFADSDLYTVKDCPLDQLDHCFVVINKRTSGIVHYKVSTIYGEIHGN